MVPESKIILDQTMFFATLSQAQRDKIAGLGELIELPFDEWLFQRNDPAGHFYILLEGKMALTMASGNGVTDHLYTVHKGDVLGWSALVSPYIYTIGAKALEPTRLVGFDGQEILKLANEDHEIGFVIYRNLSEVIGERTINALSERWNQLIQYILT
ncbi:MAG: cyclic nucleotide-binding domain-containing protein [Anaerolineales bacterium]|nr:cyclic nucleotide-binding domain-containing protein [Anaerolineales bacterium]